MDNAFHTKEPTLRSLLQEAEDGRLQLPQFQRSWVWDDERIRSLVASISRSFPIGAILTLKTGGPVRLLARPVEGATSGREPETLLLDGQQRITSLYQVTLRNEVVKTRTARNKRVERWYYIDMAKALADPSFREDAIVGVPADRVIRRDFGRETVLDLSEPSREFELGMFPLTRVFDPQDWRFDYNEHWRDRDDFRERSAFFDRFEREVLQAFQSYKLPVIELAADTSREAVCRVFEKVNTGGKPLDAFELVTASFAVDGFDLREDWTAREKRLQETSRVQGAGRAVLADLSATDFLQVVALIDGAERRALSEGADRVGVTRAALLRMETDTYRRFADEAEGALARAAKFLRTLGVFSARDLPYGSQVVPLAAIIHIMGQSWSQAQVREKVTRWFWCGVFGELYGAAVETRFLHDVAEVPAWIEGGAEPRTVAESNFRIDRLWTLQTRNAAAYKGFNALLLLEGARDWQSGQLYRDSVVFDEPVDIHHVFPVAWCNKQGIERPRYNAIVNKTPLSAAANRSIGGAAPSQYLRKIDGWLSETATADVIASHLIDAAALRADDFEAFCTARLESLVLAVEKATGKSIYRGEATDEPEEDVLDVDEAA